MQSFQNALMIHLDYDENLDTVEETLIISVPSGAFLANFKATLKFFFVKQYENLKIGATDLVVFVRNKIKDNIS